MSKMPVAAWEIPVWSSSTWAGASACSTCWDGLWGILGSNAKTQHPPWGCFEVGMGQRRAFGGRLWVDILAAWAVKRRMMGRGLFCFAFPVGSLQGPVPMGLPRTRWQPCFIMENYAYRWDVADEDMWVEGDCLGQGLSCKQEGRAWGRQPGPLSFGSLLLS